MNRDLLKYAGIGAAIVLVGLLAIFLGTRGSQIRLSGSIQKVRTQAMDAKSCVVIVDFRFVNPADYPFIVKEATLYLEDADGMSYKGTKVAAVDAKRLFDYYSKANPELGPQYNESLVVRDRVDPGESMDRMIMARFEMPAEKAEAWKRVRLRIQDVDGAVTQIEEEREEE